MATEKPKKRPADYYKNQSGRFMARLEKTKDGNLKDEIRTYPDKRQSHQVVLPYTKARAEKHTFREMSMGEIDKHFKIVNGVESKPLYGVLERKLKELEDREILRSKLIEKKTTELKARAKAKNEALQAIPVKA